MDSNDDIKMCGSYLDLLCFLKKRLSWFSRRSFSSKQFIDTGNKEMKFGSKNPSELQKKTALRIGINESLKQNKQTNNKN